MFYSSWFSPPSAPLLSFLAVGRAVLWALRRPALPRASRGPQPGTEPRQGRPQSLGSGRVTVTLCPSARTRVAVLRKGPIEAPGPRGRCPGQQGRARHPLNPPPHRTEHTDPWQVPSGGSGGPGSPHGEPLVQAEPVAPEAPGLPARNFPPFLEGGWQPRKRAWPPRVCLCQALVENKV